jgi:UDP-N-acetylmuramyl pentapeptide phosphotransferase/UDP-N-acetylglucosamine-1-phosphate transferase
LCGGVVPFLLSMILVFWVHPYVVRIATSRGLTDNPDARKLQQRPVPVLGGVAVFFGIVVGAGVTSMFFNSHALFTSIVAITVMMYIGVLDDMLGLTPILRLILEFLFIAFVAWMDQVNINDLHGVFGIGMLPVYLSAPLCIIAGLGIINAINMIDGVDGLASGFCVMACGVFGFAFWMSYDGTMAVLAALTAGALIPFFFHNVFGKESKMFIGDAGSLMMGMIMTIFVMHILDHGSRVSVNFTNMGVVAFVLSVLSVPVFDTLRVMTGRIVRGVSPFHADRSHLHHLFIEMGFSHIGTSVAVISIDFFTILCWLASYQLGASPTVQLLVVIGLGLLNTSVFYYVVRRLKHDSMPYRMLAWLARKSHVETGPMFHRIRKLMDRM